MFNAQSTQRVSTERLLPRQFGMRKMDEKTERLYEAARAAKLLDAATEQSSLARLLNVAPQNVHNWEKRGVSKDAAIEAQRLLGISATWVLYGTGPMMISATKTATEPEPDTAGHTPDVAWPFGDYARYEALSESKKRDLRAIVNAFLSGAEPEKRRSA